MKRALIFNGSLGGGHDGCDALSARLAARFEALGVSAEVLCLRELELAHCVGCFECWVESPGQCKTHDQSQDIARAWINADVTSIVTPVTFGGFSSEIKKILDRLICLVEPFFTKVEGEVHHQPRYDHYPAKLDVGELASPDPEAAAVFSKLVGRVALNTHAHIHLPLVVAAGEAPARLEVALDGAIAEVLARVAREEAVA
ncbi:flavodoxin family protein [Pseudenhygromyxa sp. WMMC2535]|uniref:NAD(P)H-dependent oxidoreductase n=1 Tax=Pseudenhygromyxa sp. WMMC2535 TaxID=2712867 RepID=UPI001556A2B3|nr:flavodoxin family protein [Pseudenhygromyxa sp. WMMC2535]